MKPNIKKRLLWCAFSAAAIAGVSWVFYAPPSSPWYGLHKTITIEQKAELPELDKQLDFQFEKIQSQFRKQILLDLLRSIDEVRIRHHAPETVSIVKEADWIKSLSDTLGNADYAPTDIAFMIWDQPSISLYSKGKPVLTLLFRSKTHIALSGQIKGEYLVSTTLTEQLLALSSIQSKN